MNGRSPFLERLFTLFGTAVHPFRFDWVNWCSPFSIRLVGRRPRLSIARRPPTLFLAFLDSLVAIQVSDDPPIAVGLAAAVSMFDGQMAAFDKASNDLLDASLGHATLRGEMSDAGPSEALPFIHEICDHIGEHEGERRQLRIGAHLVEPNEFVAHKGTVAISWRNVRVAVIDTFIRTRIEMRGITPPR